MLDFILLPLTVGLCVAENTLQPTVILLYKYFASKHLNHILVANDYDTSKKRAFKDKTFRDRKFAFLQSRCFEIYKRRASIVKGRKIFQLWEKEATPYPFLAVPGERT